MDNVFDSLFSVLPVVLGILWLLRSVKRGRKKREEKAAHPKPVVKRPADEPLHFEEAVNLEPGVPASNRAPLIKVSGNGSVRAREAAEEAAEKAEEAKAKAAAVVAARAAQAARAAKEARAEKEATAAKARHAVEDRAYPDGKPKSEGLTLTKRGRGGPAGRSETKSEAYSGHSADSSLSRIAALDPLAQGILWAAILDKPLALRPPGEVHTDIE